MYVMYNECGVLMASVWELSCVFSLLWCGSGRDFLFCFLAALVTAARSSCVCRAERKEPPAREEMTVIRTCTHTHTHAHTHFPSRRLRCGLRIILFNAWPIQLPWWILSSTFPALKFQFGTEHSAPPQDAQQANERGILLRQQQAAKGHQIGEVCSGVWRWCSGVWRRDRKSVV